VGLAKKAEEENLEALPQKTTMVSIMVVCFTAEVVAGFQMPLKEKFE
jgi:hypothetical protein